MLRNLLQMSAGFDEKETYETNPLDSTVLKMLYSSKAMDMAGFAASLPFVRNPGVQSRYSSSTTNLLMGVIYKLLSETEYEDFPWKVLFDPLQIHSATWERDGSGLYVGSSYLFLNARDLLRFGELFMHKGMGPSGRILSLDFIRFSWELAPGQGTGPEQKVEIEKQKQNEPQPGAHWWLNRSGNHGDAPSNRPWPQAPADTVAALGHWGQSLFLIPSENLMVLRFADERGADFDYSIYLKLLTQAIHP